MSPFVTVMLKTKFRITSRFYIYFINIDCEQRFNIEIAFLKNDIFVICLISFVHTAIHNLRKSQANYESECSDCSILAVDTLKNKDDVWVRGNLDMHWVRDKSILPFGFFARYSWCSACAT